MQSTTARPVTPVKTARSGTRWTTPIGMDVSRFRRSDGSGAGAEADTGGGSSVAGSSTGSTVASRPVGRLVAIVSPTGNATAVLVVATTVTGGGARPRRSR